VSKNVEADDGIPIAVLPQDSSDSDPDLSNDDSANDDLSHTEVTSSGLQSLLSQIIAQTIVFSFHQKKHFPMLHFVPSIAVSENAIQFHFYDSENDLYFVSGELNLFHANGTLHLTTVLATWLVLNHRYLSSEGTEEMKKCRKFGFHSMAKDNLVFYQKDLRMGKRFQNVKTQAVSLGNMHQFFINEVGESYANPKKRKN
jgi:hypothetical protein